MSSRFAGRSLDDEAFLAGHLPPALDAVLGVVAVAGLVLLVASHPLAFGVAWELAGRFGPRWHEVPAPEGLPGRFVIEPS